MRYPEEMILNAIVHESPEVRRLAVAYFSDSFSTNPHVFPKVIESIERYRRTNEATQFLYYYTWFQHTEDTIRWCLAELEDDELLTLSGYHDNLSRIVSHADFELVEPYSQEFLACDNFGDQARDRLVNRLDIADQIRDHETAWKKLLAYCEEHTAPEMWESFSFNYAEALVERLAHFGPKNEEQVREILSQKVNPDEESVLPWLQPQLLRLAGLTRMTSLVPLIVQLLHAAHDEDYLLEECQDALARIGTTEVVRALQEAYPSGDDSFRLGVTVVFDHMRSDDVVEAVAALLPQEQDVELRSFLATAFLRQFPRDRVEVIRPLILKPNLHPEETHVRDDLVITCLITGERFPEFDEWYHEQKQRWEKIQNRILDLEKQIEINNGRIAQLQAQRDALQQRLNEREGPEMNRHRDEPIRGVSAQAGRNDPCPCGSGKKYKKCCLK